jgi:hypothetical protein
MRNPGWVEWDERGDGTLVIEEVAEVVRFSPFDEMAEAGLELEDYNQVKLPPNVESQLRLYVETIAKLYHSTNSFHNFEHASHVAMSVSKLLNRIIVGGGGSNDSNKNDCDDQDEDRPPVIVVAESPEMKAKELHEQTYGISSDPLIQFSCVFSALIQ